MQRITSRFLFKSSFSQHSKMWGKRWIGVPTKMTQDVDIVFRPARHEDYGGLVKMGDLLQNRDFLSAMFHSFVDDPEVDFMVAVAREKLVGCGMFHLLDGGETAFFGAARVHPDFQGKRMFQQFVSRLQERLKEIKPPVKRTGVSGTNNIVSTSTFLKLGYMEILRKRMISFCYHRNDVTLLSERQRDITSSVIEMTSADVQALFENRDLVNEMFPHKVLYNRQVGYRVMNSNIKHIVNDYASMYATLKPCNKEIFDDVSDASITGSKDNCGKSKHESSVRNLSDNMLSQINMISCSQAQRTLSGVAYTCEIYCTSDIASLQTHILHHVGRIPEMTPSDGVLMVTFPDSICDGDVFPMLAEHGIKDLHPDAETHWIWYEKDNKL